MALDEAQRCALREEAREALARRDFEAFCKRSSPRYIQTPHTRMLCKYLQALADGDIRKLMIFMPPRHGKTWHASERFPAFFMGENPDAQIILASYSIDRARSSSRVVRALMRSEEWPFDVRLDPESQAVEEWRTTAGGILKASGVGGAMTGFGAHLLDIDDPLKGRKEADSALIRDGGWDWYTEVARTRLMAEGRELITTTRWHHDDIPGRILNTPVAKEWTVLRLPAIAEEGDPLGRAVGEPLAPQLGVPIPRPHLGEISTRGFQAIYQGQPSKDSGDDFRREWFRYYDVVGMQGGDMMMRLLDERGTVGKQYRLSQCRIFQIVDLARTKSDTADFTVIGTFALGPLHELIVLDWVREQFDGTQHIPQIRHAWAKWHAGRIGIEAVQFQMVAVQQAIADGLPAVPITRGRESKETRAWVIAARYEGGMVFHPRFAPWVPALEKELLDFPAGDHDDQVDVLSDAGAVVAEAAQSSMPQGVRVG